MKTHANMKGLRLFVYKPDRKGYTTIYVNWATLEELLPFVDGDTKALSAIARVASLRARPSDDQPWSVSVLKTLRKLLTRTAQERAEALAALEAQAVANNEAWDAVQ